MPVVQLKAQLSPEQLFNAVQQMPPNELEKFVARLLSLRASYYAPVLSAAES